MTGRCKCNEIAELFVTSKDVLPYERLCIRCKNEKNSAGPTSPFENKSDSVCVQTYGVQLPKLDNSTPKRNNRRIQKHILDKAALLPFQEWTAKESIPD